MRYECYGMYNKESGHNCLLGAFYSRKKAVECIQGNAANNPYFQGYFILEKVNKNSIPWGYEFFDNSGQCYRAGIMATGFKPSFWQSQKDYEQFHQKKD